MADISRTEAEALISRQDIQEVIQQATEGSAALKTFRTVNMGTKTARLPVLDALPTAGFVTEAADATGVKPTAQQVWATKTLEAEEIAVIVPIHENVFEDTELNVWDEVRPRIAEALGAVLDGAVSSSARTSRRRGRPRSRTALVPQATSAQRRRPATSSRTSTRCGRSSRPTDSTST